MLENEAHACMHACTRTHNLSAILSLRAFLSAVFRKISLNEVACLTPAVLFECYLSSRLSYLIPKVRSSYSSYVLYAILFKCIHSPVRSIDRTIDRFFFPFVRASESIFYLPFFHLARRPEDNKRSSPLIHNDREARSSEERTESGCCCCWYLQSQVPAIPQPSLASTRYSLSAASPIFLSPIPFKRHFWEIWIFRDIFLSLFSLSESWMGLFPAQRCVF